MGWPLLPLGRHSIMNGLAHRLADITDDSTDEFGHAVQRMAISWQELWGWHDEEVRRLAHSADLPEEVPLTDWFREFTGGRRESADAFARFFGAKGEPAADAGSLLAHTAPGGSWASA